MPSKPRFLMSSTHEEANFSREDGEEAGRAKFEEYVQPPMERRIFKERFCCFRRFNCFKQPYRFVPTSFQESPESGQ